MSSVASVVTLSELTFPDISGKTIRAFGQVVFAAGNYETGGLSMGLLNFADARTIDFNGFLKCTVAGEAAIVSSNIYSYRYSPTLDLLQIFLNGTELTGGAAIPAFVLADTVIFEAVWDRTTTRG
jgi:hypothetical protein